MEDCGMPEIALCADDFTSIYHSVKVVGNVAVSLKPEQVNHLSHACSFLRIILENFSRSNYTCNEHQNYILKHL
jgi:hypothetical protein